MTFEANGNLTEMKPTRLTVAAAAAGIVTYVRAMFFTPFDDNHGPLQGILYLHAPASWVAYMAFSLVAIASALYLWLREDRLDRIAESSAEVGVMFTTVALATGWVWGQPAASAYMTWSSRFGLMLALWAVYAGYLTLRGVASDNASRPKYSAILGIGGALLIPLVHLGFYLFGLMYPEAEPRSAAAGSLSIGMLVTLVLALASFTLIYVAFLRARYRYAVERDGAHPSDDHLA